MKSFVDTIVPAYYGPGVHSASNRHEYQLYRLGAGGKGGVGLTTIPSSCVDSLEIWEPHPAGVQRTCNSLVQELLDGMGG